MYEFIHMKLEQKILYNAYTRPQDKSQEKYAVGH